MLGNAFRILHVGSIFWDTVKCKTLDNLCETSRESVQNNLENLCRTLENGDSSRNLSIALQDPVMET